MSPSNRKFIDPGGERVAARSSLGDDIAINKAVGLAGWAALLLTAAMFGSSFLLAKLVVDGSTLTRNLEILVRRGLVENIVADDARVRYIRITKLGKQTFKEAVPLWRKAQRHALNALEPKRWTGMRAELHKIEAACARVA